MLESTIDVTQALLLFGTIAWTAYLIALRLSPDPSTSVRWSAAALVCFWLLTSLFYGLAFVGLFRNWLVLPLSISGAVGAHWRLSRQGRALSVLRADMQRSEEVLRGLARTPIVRWILLLAALVIGARLIRGLVAPPMAWDSLTYHLMRAGRWVQAGGFHTEHAPDAWSYYEYFGPTGDALWAWAMLPCRGDLLIAPMGLLVWFCGWLGAYAASRMLGARETLAALAATSIGLTPAVANYLTSAYVNNLVLTCFLLGSVFLGRFLSRPSGSQAGLAGAAFGLAAGIQLSAAPFLVVALVFVAVGLNRGPLTWRARLRGLSLFALGAGISLPGYLRAWIEMGSPLYPLPVTFAGLTLLPGNEELGLLLSGQLFPPSARTIPVATFLRLLFFERRDAGWEHLNLGPASLAVIGLGAVGATACLVRRGRRLFTLFLLSCAAAAIAGLTSDSMIAQRGFWAPFVGRFLTSAVAGFALLATTLGQSIPCLVLGAATLVSSYFAVPKGWSFADVDAIVSLLPWIGLGLLLAGWTFAYCRRRGLRLTALAAGSALLCLAVAPALGQVRRAHRYRIYEAAATPWNPNNVWACAYDVHTLLGSSAACWPLWQHLDDGRGHRLAVTAGWDGVGHNWYTYPLLGSKLQNEVVYIPPTKDGRVIDYRLEPELLSEADFYAWLARLVEARVELVVSLPPAPIEDQWLRTRQDLFQPSITGMSGSGQAYRLNRQAIDRLLALAARPPRSSPVERTIN